MSLIQRVCLILGALGTLAFFISRIRRGKVKISHAIFWTIFGVILLVLALMPNIMFWLCDVMGFQSPANMVYLIVIFLLVVKLFTTTLQLSHLNEQVMALTQALALHEMKENRDNGEDE